MHLIYNENCKTGQDIQVRLLLVVAFLPELLSLPSICFPFEYSFYRDITMKYYETKMFIK